MQDIDTRSPSTRFKTATPKSATYDMRTLAGLLDVSYSSVQESCQRGDLPFPAIKIGRQYRFSKAIVDQALGLSDVAPEEIAS